jgi:hypothetical protein
MCILDINGVSFNGYRTCFYRTYCVGDKPTEFQKEVYHVAYEALMALTESFKPGITTVDVQQSWLKKEMHRVCGGAYQSGLSRAGITTARWPTRSAFARVTREQPLQGPAVSLWVTSPPENLRRT